MKNTGKDSEAIFVNVLKRLYGPNVFIQQFYDAAHLHGMNHRPVMVPEQPSDKLVTLKGEMFYAEIKSVSNAKSFPFGMIKTGQMTAANLQTKAGGLYYFFVHDLASDIFYKVPASLVIITIEAGKKSLKWSEMQIWQDYETYKELHD